MTFDEEAKRSRSAPDDNKRDCEGADLSCIAQMQTLLDFLPHPIGYRDNNLNLRAANQSFADLLQSGAKAEFDIPEDMLRQAGIEPQPVDPTSDGLAMAADFAALGLDYRIDHLAHRRDDGSIAGFYTILSDQSAERETRYMQARADSMAEASGDAVIGRSLDGRITSWNRAAELMFLYRADEVVGRPVSQLFPIDKLAEQRLLLVRLAGGQRAAQAESAMRRRDGTLFDASVTLSAVRPIGRSDVRPQHGGERSYRAPPPDRRGALPRHP